MNREVGCVINPAAEPAYYGYHLPKVLTLKDRLEASGRLFITRGPGHFLLGFFNTNTLNEWRTPNTLAARFNGRGEGFLCHLEYCTSAWRAGAPLISDVAPGPLFDSILMPDDRIYNWRLWYEPNEAAGTGLLTLVLNEQTNLCTVSKEHWMDGATFTHFGLLPVFKSWDNAGEAWIADVTVNGKHFDFSKDPGWEGVGNRKT